MVEASCRPTGGRLCGSRGRGGRAGGSDHPGRRHRHRGRSEHRQSRDGDAGPGIDTEDELQARVQREQSRQQRPDRQPHILACRFDSAQRRLAERRNASIGPIPASWADDGSQCPGTGSVPGSPLAPIGDNGDSTVTITAPTTTGSKTFVVAWAKNVASPDVTGGNVTVTYNLTVAAPVDTTPPVISYVLTPGSPDGTNDWYRSNVALVWTVAEPTRPDRSSRPDVSIRASRPTRLRRPTPAPRRARVGRQALSASRSSVTRPPPRRRRRSTARRTAATTGTRRRRRGRPTARTT